MNAPRQNTALVVAATLLTFAAVFAFSMSVPLRPQGGDTVPGRYGARVRSCQGTSHLDQVEVFAHEALHGRLPYYLTVTQGGDHLVSSFGPGPEFLGRWTLPPLEPGDVFYDEQLREDARGSASLAIALAAALLSLALAATVPAWLACAGGIVVGASFAGAPVLGQALWQQTAALPLLAAALCAAAWSQRLPWLVAMAAFAAGLGATVRPPDALLFASVLALVLAQQSGAPGSKRLLIGAAVGSALGALPVALWNLEAFGNPLIVGQLSSNERMVGTLLSTAHWPEAIPGLLVSPARGLVWFAPLYFGAFLFATRKQAPLIVGLVAQFLFVAAFGQWWGGLSFGPRLLALSFWVAAFVALSSWPALGRRQQPLLGTLAVLTLAVGLLGAARYDARSWELRELGIRSTEALFRWSNTPWHEWLGKGPSPIETTPPVPGAQRYCHSPDSAISSVFR